MEYLILAFVVLICMFVVTTYTVVVKTVQKIEKYHKEVYDARERDLSRWEILIELTSAIHRIVPLDSKMKKENNNG